MARTSMPWMQWFPDDHLNDAALRACERGTRADWVDMCSRMWMRREPFLLGTPAQLARVIGVTPDEMAATIADLYANGAADVEPAPEKIAGRVACVVSMSVTYRVTSRRLTRVMRAREANAKRQKSFRDKLCNGDANGTRDGYSNASGDLFPMDAQRNAARDGVSDGHNNAPASDQISEAVEIQNVCFARARAWTAGQFQQTWIRVTKKSGMVASELLAKAASLCADSAHRLEVADVAQHGEMLIAAFPRLVDWYRASDIGAPQVCVEAFVESKHFGRCEDAVMGRLDLSVPMRAERKAGARALDPKRGQLSVATAVEEDDAPTGSIIKRRG